MRLIHCATLTLELFNNEEELPEYAILSHRWVDGQEVLFKDLIKCRNLDLSGWQKIRLCCDQALKDGIEYCWVDTCCIDKTSSAELSEAINSMYRYYSNSKVCYAYLVDVDHLAGINLEAQFVQSSWFTRCWTLQELIAPSVVEFYDKAWKKLGTRSDLCEEVAEASGIHLSVFTSRFEPKEWSIAQRMSWASNRTATRVEDVAYSLLGLFDVNMPLLYGEREKAFLRLQEEIIRRTSDHTIFGWSTSNEISSQCSTFVYTNLLASSPYAFKDDGNLIAKKSENALAYAINNLGLEISLPVIPWALNVFLVGLDCTRNSQDRVYIFVTGKTEITHISVRTICEGVVFVDLGWNLLSSTHRRLTIATHLSSSMQTPLNTLKLNQHPYLRWDHSEMNTFPVTIFTAVKSNRLASHWFSYRRPWYGFHCVLSAHDDHARRSRCIRYMKVGFDFELNPICIISDRTYDEQQVPDWFLDVNLLYSNNPDIRTKKFWECTGLEEIGWTIPDTQSSTSIPTPKSKHGIWALKGVHDSDCRFTLWGDQPGEQWNVVLLRRRDLYMRPCFEVFLKGIWEYSPRAPDMVQPREKRPRQIVCETLRTEGRDVCFDCRRGLGGHYSV